MIAKVHFSDGASNLFLVRLEESGGVVKLTAFAQDYVHSLLFEELKNIAASNDASCPLMLG
ncbi:hypothetical protein GAGA_3955 [Paraglaciecola agarilytica NO2]|uniref:Uncharacterized protein n=2 Tax=Paraglaciecola chathamensis TaxID=368405 RepID=A0ABQ0IBL2_9ALTE|nr:hypothetical protein GAGA_3955 [Paraglaciecola agarilytica NO2]